MSEFKAEPLVTLKDEKELLAVILDPKFMENDDHWKIKSVYLCDLIEEMSQTQFPYNTAVMREAEKRLGIDRQPDNSSPLSLMVYNAQGYRRHDNLVRDGFVPLTQEVVDQAYVERAKIEIHGYNILLQAIPMLYNVRKIGDICYVMPPHSRNKAVKPAGQPARIVKK